MRKAFFVLGLWAVVLPAVFASPENAEIISAAESYLTANATVTTKVIYVVEQIEGDVARVRINPENKPSSDTAWIFVKKKDGKWTGLTLGASFTTEDYQQLGIPNALRIP